jgi:hypothetical protein
MTPLGAVAANVSASQRANAIVSFIVRLLKREVVRVRRCGTVLKHMNDHFTYGHLIGCTTTDRAFDVK